MTKRVLALAVVLSLTASADVLRAQTQNPAAGAVVVAEVDRLAAKELWPGLDPRRTPIALYDGTRTLLFRHPSPPVGFSPVAGQPGVAQFDGRYAAVTANSSAQIGGEATATLMPPEAGTTLTARAGVAIHEAFHVFQRARHAAWSANEADLFTYPIGDAAQLTARRREYVLLRRALSQRDDGSAACEAFVAMVAPGWQVIVDASRRVLFPSGFDPLNVTRVADGEVLHTRFVKLGNSVGSLEVIGRGALTASAGAHPLFNGVRVVTVTGIQDEPTVTESNGTLTLAAPGVAAEFKGVTVQREGRVIRLVLGAIP